MSTLAKQCTVWKDNFQHDANSVHQHIANAGGLGASTWTSRTSLSGQSCESTKRSVTSDLHQTYGTGGACSRIGEFEIVNHFGTHASTALLSWAFFS
eukprot:1151901-Pelagomonas_calceolata.AAC.1